MFCPLPSAHKLIQIKFDTQSTGVKEQVNTGAALSTQEFAMRPENEHVQMAHGTNACQGATRATHNNEQCSQACLDYFALLALSCCDKSDESDQK